MPFHIEEDVGLGFYHSLLVGQGYSTVVEMEPTAFVGCVRGVVSRANTASTGAGKERTVRRRHTTTSSSDASAVGGKSLSPTRGRKKLAALCNSWGDASLLNLWGSKFSKVKCYGK